MKFKYLSLLALLFYTAGNSRLFAQSDTLGLPFFDDFNYYGPGPSPALWEGGDVLVNTGFGDYTHFKDSAKFLDIVRLYGPPSVGVATFDDLDANGQMHANATRDNVAFYADHLSSKPFALAGKTPEDSVTLSFFYQPGGLGDAPENGDSLILEFYAPEIKTAAGIGKWYRQAGYSTDSSQPDTAMWPFKQARFVITDGRFLLDGFRFRFTNYVSIARRDDKFGHEGRSDMWHIDHVRLGDDEGSKDSLMDDVSFALPIKPTLGYDQLTAMPWQHYLLNKNDYPITDDIRFYTRRSNNRNTTANYSDLVFMVKNLWQNQLIDSIAVGGGSELKQVDDQLALTGYPIDFGNGGDSAAIEFMSYFSIKSNSSSSNPKSNDTTCSRMYFKDYYAYDDGSAEMGYGFEGENTRYAKFAYKFNMPVADTLTGVAIHFNPTVNSTNLSVAPLYLQVWSGNDQGPQNLVYEKYGYRPAYANGMGDFIEFNIQAEDDTTASGLIIDDRFNSQAGKTFFVGLQQTTKAFLNIGMDVNHNAQNKLFVDELGADEWGTSHIKGALMIRPIFKNGAVIAKASAKNGELAFHPEVNIQDAGLAIVMPQGYTDDEVSVKLISAMGRVVVQSQYRSSTEMQLLDLPVLPMGIYFVTITCQNKTYSKGLGL